MLVGAFAFLCLPLIFLSQCVFVHVFHVCWYIFLVKCVLVNEFFLASCVHLHAFVLLHACCSQCICSCVLGHVCWFICTYIFIYIYKCIYWYINAYICICQNMIQSMFIRSANKQFQSNQHYVLFCTFVAKLQYNIRE